MKKSTYYCEFHFNSIANGCKLKFTQPFHIVNELLIKGSTPRSKGLFQRVIAQSGSNFSPSLHSITGSQASRFGTEAAVAMGCVFDFSAEARLECLQGI